MPPSPEPAAALRLLLGDGDGAFGVVGAEQALRRRTAERVAVRLPEPAAQKRYDGVGRERLVRS
jgi:hypothetical protein